VETLDKTMVAGEDVGPEASIKKTFADEFGRKLMELAEGQPHPVGELRDGCTALPDQRQYVDSFAELSPADFSMYRLPAHQGLLPGEEPPLFAELSRGRQEGSDWIPYSA
jgi:hypothetical protein